jgi:hypothetical protein
MLELDSDRLLLWNDLQCYGGRRGVFAERDIPVGSVVLAEEPVFVGPTSVLVRLLSDQSRHCSAHKALYVAGTARHYEAGNWLIRRL